MNFKTVMLAVATPAALALAVPAAAQDRMATDRMDDRQVAMSSMDQQVSGEDFVKAAAHSGHFEIESSQVALDKTSNDEVRKYAQRMIDAHQRMNAKLKEVASMTPPTKPGPGQQLIVAGLNKKDGRTFDREYVKAQLHGHAVTLAFFEAMAQSDADPELVEYAQMGAPMIRDHLRDAEDMAKKMGIK